MASEQFVNVEDIAQLLSENTSLLDVRSPSEYLSGSAPSATNLPILTDQERELVGTCYKKSGGQSAFTLGTSLVSGVVREARIQKWVEFIEQTHCKLLYCARGGLRSEIAQTWLSSEGKELARIKGGYKTLRNYFLYQLEVLPAQIPFYIVAGRTGVGKTELLRKLNSPSSVIDLENLAKHRGSAFGSMEEAQSSQATFENGIACNLMRACQAPHSVAIVEDESRTIGARVIPDKFYQVMRISPIIEVVGSLESRVDRIKLEYIFPFFEKSTSRTEAFEKLRIFLFGSLGKVERKLGNKRYRLIQSLIAEALKRHEYHNDTSMHDDWICELLVWYYDPYYDRHLARNSERVIFSGNESQVIEFIQKYSERGVQALSS